MFISNRTKIHVRLEVASTSLRGYAMREKSRDFQAIIVVILIPFWQSCISYWVITVRPTRLIFLLVIINSFLAELYFLLGWKLKRTKANTACTALIYRTIYKKHDNKSVQ
jgi:hypothetical protein